jgi:hypothetical protein
MFLKITDAILIYILKFFDFETLIKFIYVNKFFKELVQHNQYLFMSLCDGLKEKNIKEYSKYHKCMLRTYKKDTIFTLHAYRKQIKITEKRSIIFITTDEFIIMNGSYNLIITVNYFNSNKMLLRKFYYPRVDKIMDLHYNYKKNILYIRKENKIIYIIDLNYFNYFIQKMNKLIIEKPEIFKEVSILLPEKLIEKTTLNDFSYISYSTLPFFFLGNNDYINNIIKKNRELKYEKKSGSSQDKKSELVDINNERVYISLYKHKHLILIMKDGELIVFNTKTKKCNNTKLPKITLARFCEQNDMTNVMIYGRNKNRIFSIYIYNVEQNTIKLFETSVDFINKGTIIEPIFANDYLYTINQKTGEVIIYNMKTDKYSVIGIVYNGTEIHHSLFLVNDKLFIEYSEYREDGGPGSFTNDYCFEIIDFLKLQK